MIRPYCSPNAADTSFCRPGLTCVNADVGKGSVDSQDAAQCVEKAYAEDIEKWAIAEQCIHPVDCKQAATCRKPSPHGDRSLDDLASGSKKPLQTGSPCCAHMRFHSLVGGWLFTANPTNTAKLALARRTAFLAAAPQRNLAP
jgi:hypothetical protein